MHVYSSECDTPGGVRLAVDVFALTAHGWGIRSWVDIVRVVGVEGYEGERVRSALQNMRGVGELSPAPVQGYIPKSARLHTSVSQSGGCLEGRYVDPIR